MTALNLDRMIYIVFSDHAGGAYVRERDFCDSDRETTVQDILHGQCGDVVKVIECNPVEHICNDVTAAIMAEVDALREPDRPLTGQDAIEAGWDHARDSRKHEAAA
jgi:hypothetical protein